MYDPVGVPRRLTRRGKFVALYMTLAALVGIVVTVLLTMPHPQPVERFSLNEFSMVIPNAADTEVIAAMVRTRIANPAAAPAGALARPPCVPSAIPHTWDSVQRENATTIVQVGIAMEVPQRGQIVAIATAIQESKLYNLGDL